MALDEKHWNTYGLNYAEVSCYKEKLPSFYRPSKPIIEIRNSLVRTNACNCWDMFHSGISPMCIEQQHSTRWAKWAFWVALFSLTAVIVTWVLSTFILD